MSPKDIYHAFNFHTILKKNEKEIYDHNNYSAFFSWQSKKDILARNDGSAELVNFRLSCFCACHVLNWATEFIHILHMSTFMGALRFSSWETTFSFWKLSTKITSSRRWSLGWETFHSENCWHTIVPECWSFGETIFYFLLLLWKCFFPNPTLPSRI